MNQCNESFSDGKDIPLEIAVGSIVMALLVGLIVAIGFKKNCAKNQLDCENSELDKLNK